MEFVPTERPCIRSFTDTPVSVKSFQYGNGYTGETVTQRNKTGHTSKSRDFPIYLCLLHKLLPGSTTISAEVLPWSTTALLVDKCSLSMTLESGATVRGTIENSYFIRSISSLLKPVA